MSMNEPSRALADLSGAEFAALAPRNPVILLPLGSHEDHGPNLPMGDFILADVLAKQIVERCAAEGSLALAAPALPFGVADYFGAGPGGLAISPAAFRLVLRDLLDGLLRHGLTRIVILNGHGGNVPVIHEVTLAIRRERGIVIPSLYLWKIANSLMARLAPGPAERFGHGGEPLLSISRALRPGWPASQPAYEIAGGACLGLPVSGFGTLDFFGLPVDAPVEFDLVPKDAVAAAVEHGSAASGGAVVEALVAAAARFVAHISKGEAAF